MEFNEQTVGILLGILALIGPGLVYLGVSIGTLRSSTRSAHHRLDKLESTLVEEIRLLRGEIRESIQEAWRNCPVAVDHASRKGDRA